MQRSGGVVVVVTKNVKVGIVRNTRDKYLKNDSNCFESNYTSTYWQLTEGEDRSHNELKIKT